MTAEGRSVARMSWPGERSCARVEPAPIAGSTWTRRLSRARGPSWRCTRSRSVPTGRRRRWSRARGPSWRRSLWSTGRGGPARASRAGAARGRDRRRPAGHGGGPVDLDAAVVPCARAELAPIAGSTIELVEFAVGVGLMRELSGGPGDAAHRVPAGAAADHRGGRTTATSTLVGVALCELGCRADSRSRSMCVFRARAWSWPGAAAFTAVASTWAWCASSAGRPPRMAVMGRRRGRTAAGLMLVALDVPVREFGGGAAAAVDGRAARAPACKLFARRARCRGHVRRQAWCVSSAAGPQPAA